MTIIIIRYDDDIIIMIVSNTINNIIKKLTTSWDAIAVEAVGKSALQACLSKTALGCIPSPLFIYVIIISIESLRNM